MHLSVIDFSSYHEAVIEYLHSCSSAEVIIAGGCGDASLETDEIFDLPGYRGLAKRHNIILIDSNTAPLRKLKNDNCRTIEKGGTHE